MEEILSCLSISPKRIEGGQFCPKNVRAGLHGFVKIVDKISICFILFKTEHPNWRCFMKVIAAIGGCCLPVGLLGLMMLGQTVNGVKSPEMPLFLSLGGFGFVILVVLSFVEASRRWHRH